MTIGASTWRIVAGPSQGKPVTTALQKVSALSTGTRFERLLYFPPRKGPFLLHLSGRKEETRNHQSSIYVFRNQLRDDLSQDHQTAQSRTRIHNRKAEKESG